MFSFISLNQGNALRILIVVIRKETSNVVLDGFNSTNSSKLTPIRDGAALLSPSARWVNAPAPDSLYHSSPQRSLLRSVLSPIRSCSSCLFPSRVFNQIASTTNLFSPIFYIIQSFPWTETYLKNIPSFQLLFNSPTNMEKLPLL